MISHHLQPLSGWRSSAHVGTSAVDGEESLKQAEEGSLVTNATANAREAEWGCRAVYLRRGASPGGTQMRGRIGEGEALGGGVKMAAPFSILET